MTLCIVKFSFVKYSFTNRNTTYINTVTHLVMETVCEVEVQLRVVPFHGPVLSPRRWPRAQVTLRPHRYNNAVTVIETMMLGVN